MSFVEKKLIERIRMECSAHTLKGFHANMVLHLFIDKLHAKFLKRSLTEPKLFSRQIFVYQKFIFIAAEIRNLIQGVHI